MERLKKIGRLPVYSSGEVSASPLGLGFEKLDRDAFDPEKAYDRVAETGVKWIRLQSGWQKTEREKGVYDFAWLDSVVDNLRMRGLLPWFCLCYGNRLYDELAATVHGAAGCPPVHTDEMRNAWDAYVRATVEHFRGRVQWYEVWNEPDGLWCWKTGVNAAELGNFTIATARAIRETDPDAKVIGGCVCKRSLQYITEAFETGMGDWIDAVTFHEYTADETKVAERVSSLRALARRYAPDIAVIQGESGSQSRSDGMGALRGGAWTPDKQAKQLLRHALADISAGVMFSSYFSCMDMQEGLNGKAGDVSTFRDFGYFGILGAEFDENARATGEYRPKKSFYALQNLASLMANGAEVCEVPVLMQPEESFRVQGWDDKGTDITRLGFRRGNGFAYAYWKPTDLMTTCYDGTVTVQYAAMPSVPVLADPMDGSLYEFPQSMIRDEGHGCVTLVHIPVKDYPMFLLFGDY